MQLESMTVKMKMVCCVKNYTCFICIIQPINFCGFYKVVEETDQLPDES